MAALRVSRLYISQVNIDENKARKLAEPFLVKSVIKAFMIIIEDHSSVAQCDAVMWLFANLMYSAEIEFGFLSQKDISSILNLLKICNDNPTKETLELADKICLLFQNIMYHWVEYRDDILNSGGLEELSIALDLFTNEFSHLNNKSCFACLNILSMKFENFQQE